MNTTDHLAPGTVTSGAPGARPVDRPRQTTASTPTSSSSAPARLRCCATALALATYGVRVRAVATRWNWVANSPRAHITNQRHPRGAARPRGRSRRRLKHVATPWELMGDTLFATSLARALRSPGCVPGAPGTNRHRRLRRKAAPAPMARHPAALHGAGADQERRRRARLPSSTSTPSTCRPRPGRRRRHQHTARPAVRRRVHRPQRLPASATLAPARRSSRNSDCPSKARWAAPARSTPCSTPTSPATSRTAEHPALDHDARRRLRRDRYGHVPPPSVPGPSGSPAGGTTSTAPNPTCDPKPSCPASAR